MRKYIIFILLLLVSLSLTPFSYETSAQSEIITFDTYYPNNILDYADLTNIKCFSISDNYIAYTLDGTILKVFDKSNKTTTEIENFSEIKLIKYVNDTILIVDNNKILIINNLEELNADNLPILKNDLPTLKGIDIYSTPNKTLIGYSYDDKFELLTYSKLTANATPDNTKIFSSGYYLNTYMIAINDKCAYIVYSKNNFGQNGICIQNYEDETITIKDNFIVYAKLLDTFYYNGKSYLIAFTDEILVLLNENIETLCDIKIGTEIDIENNSFPILSLSHIDYLNDIIYVSDIGNKTIQSFTILNNENIFALKSQEILLCSQSQAKGRFNSVDNIFIQGNTIITADTGNNRIQILDNTDSSNSETSIIVDMPTSYSSPISITRDRNNNLYVVATNNSNHKILKYTPKNCEYYLSNTFTPAKSSCKISSITTVGNIVYGLDYHNNELIYQSNDTTYTKCKILNKSNLLVDLNANSKLIYLKQLQNFVILNDNILYLLNNNGELIDEMNVTDSVDITCGISEIYLLTNNKLQLIIINNDQFIQSQEITNSNFSKLSTIAFDAINRKIYGFDSNKSCIISFICEFADTPFVFEDFTTSDSNTLDTIPYIYITSGNLIYTHPYDLGETFNNDNTINYFISIGNFDDYVRLIFNKNNTLHTGYIHKDNCTKLEYTYNVINVITINEKVSIYKYPTLLKINNYPLITEQLNIGSKITLTHISPASIDGETFYMYKQNNYVGFINSTDILLDTNSSITNLNTENATIKLIKEDYIPLLADDKTTVVYTLYNDSRIYVENYDKNSTYTKVIYKDKNLKTYEGYVLTENIKMDKLDTSGIILIALIIVSIIILVIIIISYITIKKKK